MSAGSDRVEGSELGALSGVGGRLVFSQIYLFHDSSFDPALNSLFFLKDLHSKLVSDF